MPPHRRPPVAPLYDSQFEHDACGIGFVADAGGRNLGRVLPLALGGLSALGHRGAFGADGESSDGAGIALPLEGAVLDGIVPGAGADRPGVAVLFMPRGRGRVARARTIVADAFAAEDLNIATWRRVPMDPKALGGAAAGSRPTVMQAIVARPVRAAADPRPLTDDTFERRLVVARRHPRRSPRHTHRARSAGHTAEWRDVGAAVASAVSGRERQGEGGRPIGTREEPVPIGLEPLGD